MSPGNDNLSRNLGALLPRLGSDTTVATRLGVKQSSVWRWRTGKTIPDPDHVEALAVAIGLDSAELRYGDYADRASDSVGTSEANV